MIRLRPLLLSLALFLAYTLQPTGAVARAGALSVTLPDSRVSNLAAARRLSALDPHRSLGVALSLKVRDGPGLQSFLAALYDARSPLFHHFLTPAQFAARFAPLPAERERVVSWLQGNGLRVVQRFGNGLQLSAEGSVGHIEAAFGVRIFNYLRGSRRFFANAEPAHLPRDLSSQILAVSGLSNDELLQSHLNRLRSHQQGGPHGLAPQDLASLYNLQPLYHQGVSGAGTTIALAEFADYDQANIATYDQQYGIAGSVERVSVHTPTSTGAHMGDGQDECELDIEMVHAAAPAGHILVYEAPNGRVGNLSLWNQIVSDNRAQVISTSWGKPENSVSSQTIHALNQVFEEAAAQGQSVFAASGDNGAYDASGGFALGHAAGTSPAPKANKQLMVDFPSSDPWVTGVGGTTLLTKADGSYDHETAWSNAFDSNNPVGGGGGLSTVFRRPYYQAGPGVANRYSNGMRQIPDVAADADPATGYSIYTLDNGKPRWQTVGGTSASAPLWASFALLVDQSQGKRIGLLNPTLYALGQRAGSLPQPPFHDIVEGTNLYYPATPGWDFATGWGSFDTTALLNDIRAIGGIVSARLPTVDFSLEAEVASRNQGQFVAVTQARRGQVVYLVTYVSVTRIAGSSDAQRTLSLALKGHSLYRRTVADHFGTVDAGRTVVRSVRMRIPRTAALGRYTLTVLQTIQGVTEQATARVRIR